MQLWLEIFSMVASIALVVQVGILIALFLQVKRTTETVNNTVKDLNTRVGPILTRTQILLDETQPKISAMVEDASQVVYLARSQAQRLDRVVGEATDRLRGQIVQADRIITGTLDAVEDAGTTVRRGFLGPVQKASALVQGIKVGLDVLRSRRAKQERAAERHEVVEQEDELFI